MKIFGWWNRLDQHFREFLIGIYIVYAVVSAIVAAVITTDMRSQGKTGCVYKSLVSVLNIPFVLTCELSRERFLIEPGKKK